MPRARHSYLSTAAGSTRDACSARDTLLKRERARFFKDEWPSLRERLRRLGIDMRALAETAEEK